MIQKLGRVSDLERTPDQLRICVESGWSDVRVGESVAVNGVCLTATETSSNGKLYFYVSRETLDRSNLRTLEREAEVNLERALLATDRLSGHIVQGHVDGEAHLLSVRPVAESHELRFELSPQTSKYCVAKGSIALNGVSLTINEIRGSEVCIMIIPHTWEQTNLSKLKAGDSVNVEVDLLAKYAEKLLQARA